MSDTGLLHSQTHIPRRPSGSVSRVAVGTGGGTVGIEVGAIHREIVAHYISLYACVQCVCIPSLFFSANRAFLGRKIVKLLLGPFIPRSFILRTAL